MSTSAHSNRLVIGIIMVSLCLWGGLLALGAYLYNLDARKAIIVTFCVIAFLGLWAMVLVKAARQRATDTASRGAEGERPNPQGSQTWSRACLSSFVLSISGIVVFSSFRFLVTLENKSLDLTIKSAALIGLAIATITAMVGLSDPHRHRGKWLAIIGVMMIGGLFVVWLAALSRPV